MIYNLCTLDFFIYKNPMYIDDTRAKIESVSRVAKSSGITSSFWFLSP